MTFFAGPMVVKILEVSDWEPTPCAIMRLDASADPAGSQLYDVYGRFRYEIEGRKYFSENLALEEIHFVGFSDADTYMTR